MNPLSIKQKRFIYRALCVGLGIFCGFALIAQMCFRHVEAKTEASTFDAINRVPHQKVALVLGTSKRVRDGRPNLFFKYRMDAAEALFKQG